MIKIAVEEAVKIREARKANKDKRIDRRLQVLLLRAEGKRASEIAEVCQYNKKGISRIVSRYNKFGLEAMYNNNYKGNRRNLTFLQEEEMLKEFERSANAGQMITTGEMKAAYEKRIGHKSGGSTIYMLLKRHGWRKVMPRSKHPDKASEEAIEASKKLTFGWMK
jgi:transposase